MLEQMIYALPFLMKGFWMTLQVAFLTVSMSLVAGVVLGVLLIYAPLPIRLAIRLVTDTVRGIPILVLIFFVYYGFPAVGIDFPAFWAAVAALTLFKTAQVIEYVRGAVQSVPKGQDEAAKAVGLTFPERLWYVIFPQAARRFLPPWVNGVADAVKGSALVSLLGVSDLMHAINMVIGRTYDAMPLYVLGALIYFAVNYSLSQLARWLERRLSYAQA